MQPIVVAHVAMSCHQQPCQAQPRRCFCTTFAVQHKFMRSGMTYGLLAQGLSRYRHVRELQAGSTAVVHLVEDKHSGKPLAIKLLDRSSCDLGTAREVSYHCTARRA